MVLNGKVIKSFNYMVVMNSTFLGNFVFYPSTGDFAHQTVAVDVYKDTLISYGGKTYRAKDLNLTNIIKTPRRAVIELVGRPHKLPKDSIAQYSAHAQKITFVLTQDLDESSEEDEVQEDDEVKD